MEERILEVISVSKSFGRIKALSDISFYLKRGEILSILGENGSGKSTLIKIIAGLIRPLKGEVRVFGKDSLRERDVYLRMNFLFHEPLFYSELTLYENLYLTSKLFGIRDFNQKIENLSREFLIYHKLNEKVKNLSRGEVQKGGFVRAFLNDPDILVLDEPFTGIDEEGREILIKKFLKFKNDGKSIVFSTHQREVALFLADKILLISKGERKFFGEKREFIPTPRDFPCNPL